MKVMYVITKASFGGAQKYVLDLSSYFVSRGHKVLVIHGKNDLSGGDIFLKKMNDANVAHTEIPGLKRDISFLDEVRVFFSLTSLFRQEKPDIIHLNSSKIGIVGSLAARAVRARRIVYTVHGLPFLEDRPTWQNYIIKLITWLTFLCSHKVILVSKFEENRIKKWWFIKNKVHQIYNGIDIRTDSFLSRAQARATLVERFNLPITQSTYVIGSIAELTDNKGLLDFLPKLAERKKRGEKFIYVHFGTGKLAKKLETLTSRLNLDVNVFWLGMVPEASKYLKALDVFTLPSKKEGLPYVLLEAKLAGIKIEASKVGGVNEILNNPMSDFRIVMMYDKTSALYSS